MLHHTWKIPELFFGCKRGRMLILGKNGNVLGLEYRM